MKAATKTLLTALLAIASAASLTLAQADAMGGQPCLGVPAIQLPALHMAHAPAALDAAAQT